MLKRSITFENPFTNEQATEEHYFHISKADLVEMEMEVHNATYTKDGETFTGMQAKLQRIVDSGDGKAIMEEMKDIIRRSYGKKEGDRFVKSEEAWKEFSSSEAYSQLIFELCTEADAAADFMNGVVPSNLEQIAREVAARAEKEEKAGEATVTALPTPSTPPAETDRSRELANATSENPVELTRAEVTSMDDHILKSGLADGRFKLS